MKAKLISFTFLFLSLSIATAPADITQTTYQIDPGGLYTYKPSPESPGIPGGMPDAYQLDFGISGTFDYELDTAGPTARLFNLHLVLFGNEAIQAAAPPFAYVTPERVELYLASHTFIQDFIGGLLHLKSSTDEGLKLTDGLNGSLSIDGGFDSTFVDGTAALFDFSATAIPEPACIALVVAALPMFSGRRRLSMRKEGNAFA